MPTNELTTAKLHTEEIKLLTEALAAPFEASAVRFKPGKISGNRAMALVYVDARAIQDRLDQVLGVLGWQDEYECLPDGSVVCRLRMRLGEEWITKMDVGAPSEQPDEGDRRKAAFSDALKRAAVKFGIGRYLYRVGALWVDYDPQKRQFVRPPVLPANLVAPPARKVKPEPKVAIPAEPAAEPEKPGPRPALPANGLELQQRLNAFDTQLARQGLCKPGDLVKHVVQAGNQAGFASDLASWSGPAIIFAVEETRTFANRMREQAPRIREVA
jgi:hypothetical protein